MNMPSTETTTIPAPSDVEKRARTADKTMKGYFIFSTAISVAANSHLPVVQQVAQLTAAGLLTGAVWNGVDSVGGIAVGYDDYQKARKSVCHRHQKLTLATLNMVWSAAIMPGCTTWGLVSTIKAMASHGGMKELFKSGIALGGHAALAASSFSFAGAMFICAANSAIGAYGAQQKSKPLHLLKDRIKKYNHEIKRQAPRTERLTALKKDIIALHDKVQYEGEGVNELKINDNENEKILSVFVTEARQSIRIDEQHAENLINKQKQKARTKKMDACAWTLAGIGAMCVGLAILFPPAAPVLGILGVVGYACAASIKAKQLKGQSSWPRLFSSKHRVPDHAAAALPQAAAPSS